MLQLFTTLNRFYYKRKFCSTCKPGMKFSRLLLAPLSRRSFSNSKQIEEQNKQIIKTPITGIKAPVKAGANDQFITDVELGNLYVASSASGAALLLLSILCNDEENFMNRKPTSMEQKFIEYLVG